MSGRNVLKYILIGAGLSVFLSTVVKDERSWTVIVVTVLVVMTLLPVVEHLVRKKR